MSHGTLLLCGAAVTRRFGRPVPANRCLLNQPMCMNTVVSISKQLYVCVD